MPVARRTGAGLSAILLDHAYRRRPSWLARSLLPLAALYGALAALDRRRGMRRAQRLRPPVPVVVVGNVVAGGAGKTPTVVAIVKALVAAGRHPGVVSRGYGRSANAPMAVTARTPARLAGDEALLIHLRTQVPVWVGRDRTRAAAALCRAHPDVDVIVSDDGLQHTALARDLDVVVLDERGIGNGLLLPAGPLRQPFGARPPAGALVLYNATAPSTPWPGRLVGRRVEVAVPLQSWAVGSDAQARPLTDLGQQPLIAAAGIAVPERFFARLAEAGLRFEPLPLPDHFDYAELPFADDSRAIVTTEKDAVKLRDDPRLAARQRTVWVVPLDFELPDDFIAEMLARIEPAAAR